MDPPAHVFMKRVRHNGKSSSTNSVLSNLAMLLDVDKARLPREPYALEGWILEI